MSTRFFTNDGENAPLKKFAGVVEFLRHLNSGLFDRAISPGHQLVVDSESRETTGGSTIQGIEKIEADGGKVAFAIVLVDRQEQGGRENIERRCPVVSIFNRQDVLAADATKQPHPAAA